MLLVKICQFFLYLVLVKTRLEIRLNNVLDRKETFFEYKNKIFESPKHGSFPKGLTHPFFVVKNKIVDSLKNCIFPEGLTHALGQKMANFSLFRFGQIPVFS